MPLSYFSASGKARNRQATTGIQYSTDTNPIVMATLSNLIQLKFPPSIVVHLDCPSTGHYLFLLSIVFTKPL